jgi:hypothetical protein
LRPFGSAERQVIDAAFDVSRLADPRDHLEVGDAPSDRHLKLMRVDQSSEREASALSADRFGQEIGIPSEERSSANAARSRSSAWFSRLEPSPEDPR